MMIEQVENVKVDLAQQPSCEEIIVLRYNIDKLDLFEVRDIHLYLTKEFPNNKVIAIPDDASLNFFSKEEVEGILKNIQKFLDEAGQN